MVSASMVVSHSTIWLLVLLKFCTDATLVENICTVKLPYRGKLIHPGESNEEIFRQYQAKLDEYRALAFSTRSDWNILSQTSDGIEIATLPAEDDRDCPYVRMKATMPTSAQSLYNFMSFANWKIFMPIINPFYQGINVMHELEFQEKKLVVARKHSKNILGFGRRDFSLLAVTSDAYPRNDGTLVSGTITVIAPQMIPRYKGFTRAFQDMVCFYHPAGRHADGTHQTELIIMLRTDLNDATSGGTGGAVPMWLVVNTIGLSGSKAMHGLRKVVRKHLRTQDVPA